MLSFAYRYTLLALALVLREQGDYARAIALCEEGLALSRTVGDAEGRAIALLSLADVARDQGDTGRVRAYGEESRALFRELGHPWAIGFALNNLARAARHIEDSVTIFRGQQAGPSLAGVLITLGRVQGAQGKVANAWADLTEALTLAGAAGPRIVMAATLEELAMQAIWQGQARHGVRLLGAAVTLRQTMGTPIPPADQPAIEGALATARLSG